MSDCKVIDTSGHQSFDAIALAYVKRRHYQPTIKHGIPVKVYGHHYTIRFVLDN